MDTTKREELLVAYHNVFAPNGDVKACGRLKCMALIHQCSICNPSSAKSFGNMNTGTMKISHIKEFMAEEFPEVIFCEIFLKVFDRNGALIVNPEESQPLIVSLLTMASKLDPSFASTLTPSINFDKKTQKALKVLYSKVVISK